MAKWIQLDSGFYRHTKTLRLKRAIGPAALWVPPRLWAYCTEHESDDISLLSPEDLCDVLEYEGDAGALVASLKSCGFITEDGKTVTGWAERYGAKLEFYRNRAQRAANARWAKTGPSSGNTKNRQDKTSKHRQASLKDASSMLPASASAGSVSRFIIPTPEEVTAYAEEVGYPLNGAAWCDSYAQKGWMVGRSKMKDWRAAVRNWKTNGWKPNGATTTAQSQAQRDYRLMSETQ
jgi:hypothetical protein